MVFLLISIAALFSGLGLSAFLLRSEASAPVSVFEGFVSTFIACIVLLEILPHCFGQLSWWSGLICILGFLSIGIAEWFSLSRWQWLGWGGFVLGFGFHAFIDGAALGLYDQLQGAELYFLALAILIHRLPVGAVLGMGLNKRAAYAVTGMIAVATILGFFSVQVVEQRWLFPLQAFAAGVLGHVVFEHSISKEPQPLFRLLGAVIAGGFFGGLEIEFDHGHEERGIDLWTMVTLGLILLLVLKPRKGGEVIGLNGFDQSVS